MTDERTRLKNLLSLAERGEPGEAQAARQILNKLLGKLGLTEADLQDEKLAYCEYRFKTKQERTILIQVACMVTGETIVYTQKRRGRKALSIKLTPRQATDVALMFAAYLDDWRQLVEDALDAFVARNNIYPNVEPTERDEPPTAEELERWARIANLASGMRVTPVRKMLR
jgi:hypothetical protein